MKCGNEGALRAYLDAELPAVTREAMGSHLAACGRCRDELEELRHTARGVAGWMTPEPAEPTPAAIALGRLRARLRDADDRTPVASRLLQWVAATYPRLVAAGAMVAALAALLTLTPMRLAAEDLLGIFRVQKFAAVTVDLSQLPRLPSPDKVAGHRAFTPPEVREATVGDAARAVDFPVRQPGYLPAALAGQSRTLVSSPAEASFTVDLAALKEYLAQMGGQDVKLPASLDGATLRARMPASVITVYGSAAVAKLEEGAAAPAGPYLILGQSRGPTLEVPDTVDVALLREQVLALPVLPPELAAQLRAIKDWRNTLVIPVRAGTQRDVTVAGAPALLISHSDQENTVLWQRDGVVYALSGSVTEGDLMRIANSLR